MSKSHLSPCPGCARHVRVSESACPFCGVSLSEAFRAQDAPRPIVARLGRAALYALGAGTIALTSTCSSTNTQVAPPYGAPPREDAGQILDAAYDAPVVDSGTGGIMPLYGAPAQVDARSNATDGGPRNDGGTD